MTVDVPDEFIPDKTIVLDPASFPLCDGCGKPFEQLIDHLIRGQVSEGAVRYDGGLWHYECAVRDNEELERGAGRLCRGCGVYHSCEAVGTNADGMRCCGFCERVFYGPAPEEYLGRLAREEGGEP